MANTDKEADFAFDLFSDIAPLLALFGDQFARQFASESLTWVDHLIFSMVPLGILTAITGAIRVQGPRIAKSFIGRGRENRALAEIELMSSTSKEVCELFNGKSIIRVMGKPKIAQILVFPDKYKELETLYEREDRKLLETQALSQDRSCGVHTLKGAVTGEDMSSPLMDCVEYHSLSYTLLMEVIERARRSFGWSKKPETESETKGKDEPEQKFEWLGPPNLQLGLSSNQFDQSTIRKSHEVFLAAIAAVVLQLGLIALATVTIYHSSTRKAIPFEAENYGYSCYIVGTVLLCVGIGICSNAIERNTSEYEWKVRPPEQEAELASKELHSRLKNAYPRLLWLQQRQEVNDQAFDGYVILAGPKRHVITSSRLEDTKKDQLKNEKWELLTICGVIAAGLGFIAQFMGLRGLAYPCSIAQLIAILLMALIRAMIRRRLGVVPSHFAISAGYEIDYLAICLVTGEDFRNYEEGKEPKVPLLSQEVLRWKVRTAMDHELPVSGRTLEQIGSQTSNIDPNEIKIPGQFLCKRRHLAANTGPSCQQLVRVRERLGDLCKWQSNALESALSLASSIEAFLNTFPLAGDSDFLEWTLETVRLHPAGLKSEQYGFVSIPVKKHGGKWRADIGKIEAIISLWMASTEARTKAERKVASGAPSKSTREIRDPTNWRRTKAGSNLRYKFCRILGNDLEDDKLKRDLSWWVDDLIAERSDGTAIDGENEDIWAFSKAREEEVGLIIGFNGREDIDGATPPSAKSRELAITDIGLLPSIIAQHMFTSFMWTVVEHLPENCLRPGYADTEHEIEIEGRHTFDLQGIENTWHRPTLRHKKLTNLVHELEKNGLGKYTDILLCIIPALSSKDLLPNHVMLRLIPPMRQDQGWTAIARAYSSLLNTRVRTFPPELFCYSVVVGAMDFLQFACEPYDSCIDPQKELGHELQQLVDQLKSPRYQQVLVQLAPSYAIQRRWTKFQEIFNQYGIPTKAALPATNDAVSIASNTSIKTDEQLGAFNGPPGPLDVSFCIGKLGFSNVFKEIYTLLEREHATTELASGEYMPVRRRLTFTHEDVKAVQDAKSPDMFGWCPLHYAALSKNLWAISRIFGSLLDRENVDIHTLHDKANQTPLHVAMAAGNDEALSWTLESYESEVKKQALNSSGLNQMTPLLLSVKSGSLECVREVLEQGPRESMTNRDLWGREAIHLASSYGHDDIASLLLSKGAQLNLIDDVDRSPLDYLLKGDVDLTSPAKNHNDAAVDNIQAERERRTESKRKMFVKFALSKPEYRDKQGRTFLHRAVQLVDTNTVIQLVKKGYNLHEPDSQGLLPLHLAAVKGRLDMVQLLLEGIDTSVEDSSATIKQGVKAISDPTLGDKEKETALMFAARHGHLEVVQFLIEGTKIEPESNRLQLGRNSLGWTALRHAIGNEENEIALYLLGIQPLQEDSKDNRGDSLLLAACQRTTRKECVRKLLEQWPEVVNDPDDAYKQTPLSWACEREQEGIVKELIACKGIDVNKQATGWKQFAPLHSAADEGNSTIVELLLESAHIDLNLKDDTGRTPLDVAIEKRHANVVRTFLTCATVDGQIRLECLKNLSVNSHAAMRSIIPDLLIGMSNDSLLDEDLLKLVEMSEDLRNTAAYAVLARWALNRKTTQMRVKPGPMHVAARLNDLDLMKTICALENIESTSVDQDGWTCIEYANTYRSDPVSQEINQLAQQKTPATSLAQGRIMPTSLNLDQIAKSISDTGCASPDHGGCIGIHAVRITDRISYDEGRAAPYNTWIRTLQCVPPLTASTTSFYHEITIVRESKTKIVGIGFCDKQHDRGTMIGWQSISFAYHGDDGALFINPREDKKLPEYTMIPSGPYGAGDTVGIGLNLKTGEGFVTKNGEKVDIGEVFQSATSRFIGRKMYPCVGFDNPEGGNGLQFEWNLGASDHPFKYQGSSALRSGKASM